MKPDWIVVEVGFDERDGGWLTVWGVNTCHAEPIQGETARYFKWRVRELCDRYDMGMAKLQDNVPFARLQQAFGLPPAYVHSDKQKIQKI